MTDDPVANRQLIVQPSITETRAVFVPVRGDSEWRRMLRQLRKRRLAMLGLAILVIEILAIALGPSLLPFDPIQVDVKSRLQPPSWTHLMGTDELGRDIFTRVLYGGQVSLFIGVSAVFLGLTIGVGLGLGSGYFGGLVDETAMRLIDVLLSFPGILLAIVIVAILGPSTESVILAVAVFSVPLFARVVRGSTLTVRNTTYIEAARSVGAGHWRIIWRHILPNVRAPIIVLFSLSVGLAILSETGLNFIGLGSAPPSPDWGLMLSSGRNYLADQWWIATFPGLAILVTVFALNLLGDGVRDALDPRVSVVS